LISGSMLHDAPRSHRYRKAFKRRGGFKTLPYREPAMLPGRQTFISTPRAGTRARPYNALHTTHHAPTTGVLAGYEAEIEPPLTSPPHATSHLLQASPRYHVPRTTYYELRTDYRGPCWMRSRDRVAFNEPTTCHELQATGQFRYYELHTNTHQAPCSYLTLTPPACRLEVA